MRGPGLLLVSLCLVACGGSSKSPTGSPDGGTLASSDKDKCELYLTCLNLADQAAYADQLALYGDSSACWQSSTTSANCASACVSAYADIASECSCASPTSCTLCPSAKVPTELTLYAAVASPGSCLMASDLAIRRTSDSVQIGFNTNGYVGQTSDDEVDPEVNLVVPLTCDLESAPVTWSGSNEGEYCPGALSGSGSFTFNSDGTATLTFSISNVTASAMSGNAVCSQDPSQYSPCAGTFTLTPMN